MRLTKQEMFNRAVVGLRSQGFERCVNAYSEPLYCDSSGKHCAVGWIDTDLRADQSTWFVDDLAIETKGVLSHMTIDELEFARQLQWCHDEATTPAIMERRLKRLGERLKLTWPQ